MSKPSDLIDHLAATGTGAGKLAAARAFAEANPGAGVLEVYDRLVAGGCGEVTLKKARTFLGVDAVPAAAGDAGRPAFPVRAPAGGVSVGGVAYAAGERVPRAAVDAATAEEVRALLADPTPTLQPVAVPPPDAEPAADDDKKPAAGKKK